MCCHHGRRVDHAGSTLTEPPFAGLTIETPTATAAPAFRIDERKSTSDEVAPSGSQSPVPTPEPFSAISTIYPARATSASGATAGSGETHCADIVAADRVFAQAVTATCRNSC